MEWNTLRLVKVTDQLYQTELKVTSAEKRQQQQQRKTLSPKVTATVAPLCQLC